VKGTAQTSSYSWGKNKRQVYSKGEKRRLEKCESRRETEAALGVSPTKKGGIKGEEDYNPGEEGFKTPIRNPSISKGDHRLPFPERKRLKRVRTKRGDQQRLSAVTEGMGPKRKDQTKGRGGKKSN